MGGDDGIRLALLYHQEAVGGGGNTLGFAHSRHLFIEEALLNGAALDNDRLIAEVVRRSDGSQVLSAYHQTIAGVFGAVVIAVRKLHGLRPFGGVGQSGNRHIILAGGNTRQHRCEIQRDNVTFYAKFVRNMVSQFNVRTHIFLVPLLGGVDEFHGSKIGFCDHFEITGAP